MIFDYYNVPALPTSDDQPEDVITRCPSCLRVIVGSKVLPCSHVVCTRCLQLFCENMKDTNGFICPVCKVICTSPTEVSKFPENDFIEALLKVRTLQKVNASNVQCILCLGDEEGAQPKRASFHCFHCLKNTCATCAINHENSLHRIVPIAELIDSGEDHIKCPVNNCPLHLGEELNKYCADHEISMCTICCEYHNLCHKPRDLENAFIMIKLDVMRVFDINASKNMTKLKEICEKLRLQIQNTQANIRSRGSEIKSRNAQKTNLVDNHVECLLRVSKRAEMTTRQELEDLSMKHASAKSCIQSFVAYLNEILNKGTLLRIACQPSYLIAKGENIILPKIQALHVIEDADFFTIIAIWNYSSKRTMKQPLKESSEYVFDTDLITVVSNTWFIYLCLGCHWNERNG